MLKIARLISPLTISLTIFVAVIASLLVLAQFTGRNPHASNSQAPVVIKQLPKENGIIPVELTCGQARLANPKEVDGFTCSLKNNTDEDIKAISTVYRIVTEKNGREADTPNYLTIDSMIHPDLVMDHVHQAIPPGGVQPLDVNERTIYDDALIQRVEINIDYVEFGDGNSLGPNVKGSQIIQSIRKGAAKYKNWLVERYRQNGNSVVETIQSIQKQEPLPIGIGLDDMYSRQGAKIYRGHLLKIYDSNGSSELEHILNGTESNK